MPRLDHTGRLLPSTLKEHLVFWAVVIPLGVAGYFVVRWLVDKFKPLNSALTNYITDQWGEIGQIVGVILFLAFLGALFYYGTRSGRKP